MQKKRNEKPFKNIRRSYFLFILIDKSNLLKKLYSFIIIIFINYVKCMEKLLIYTNFLFLQYFP
jgi:hypothetical protein